MSETQSLWLVLALIYAVECIAWLCRDAVGFRSWLGRRFRLVRPARLAGNHRGGFVPVHPLPPLGTLLVAHPLPLDAAPEGVLVNGSVFTWDALKNVEVTNQQLRLKGAVVCRCGSNAQAAALASELRAVAASSPELRAKAVIKWLQRTMDLRAVQARLNDLAAGSRRLRRLCIGLWTFVFVVAPAAVYWRGLELTWWWLLPVLFVFTSLIATTFRREHRQRHPAAEDERFSFFLTFLLSPASAVRAVDALSRSQLAMFHPLAVARALAAKSEFLALAGQAVREARFQPAGVPSGEAGAIQQFARESWRRILEEWLREQGIDPEQAVLPPARVEASDRGYCPRCQTPYTRADGGCGDCGGVPLKAFP